MKDIGGKVVVVTGASRGLGLAIAQALFDHGMKVVISARGADELAETQKLLDRSGARSLAVPADITKAADRVGLLAATKARPAASTMMIPLSGMRLMFILLLLPSCGSPRGRCRRRPPLPA